MSRPGVGRAAILVGLMLAVAACQPEHGPEKPQPAPTVNRLAAPV